MNFYVLFYLNFTFLRINIISCWPMFISQDVPHNDFDIMFPKFPSKIFLTAQGRPPGIGSDS